MRRLFGVLLCLSIAHSASAADWLNVLVQPRPGHQSQTLTHPDATLLHRYPQGDLVRIPAAALDGVQASAAESYLTLEARPTDALIHLPTGVIDVRTATPRMKPTELTAERTPSMLLVLQFVGPPTTEWLKEVEDAGVRVVQYLPENAYIVSAAPRMIAALNATPRIQWLDAYHPDQKPNELERTQGETSGILGVVPSDGFDQTLAAILKKDPTAAQLSHTERDNRAYIAFRRLNKNDILELLALPMVLGAFAEPGLQLSDGRQTLALTPNTTFNSETHVESLSQTTTNYQSWLSANCSVCSSMSNFYVGVADTGVDGGPSGNAHPDLAGRVIWATDYSGQLHPDQNGHGTMVAGVIAGNGNGTGMTDALPPPPPPSGCTICTYSPSLGYPLGHGVAPSARIVATKAFFNDGSPTSTSESRIFDLTKDALTNAAYIQNHSANQYDATGVNGRYTLTARSFDLAVRDGNQSASYEQPITLTVSAGNTFQGVDQTSKLALAPATAKNVIAMGMAENWRTNWNTKYQPTCENESHWSMSTCRGAASSLRTVSELSRRGTVDTAGSNLKGRLKPDLYAPATMIVSTRSRYWHPAVLNPLPWCNQKFDETIDTICRPTGSYMMLTGTSFAAPVAAGAAAIAARVYSSNPAAARPSLIKAMLVGSATSMKDGIDKFNGSSIIAQRVTSSQSFGRIGLERLVATSPARAYLNETTIFTQSLGTPWQTTYTVDDATKPVIVSLAWSDAAAAELATVALVNNLDLSVQTTSAGGSCVIYIGNAIGSNDLSTAGSCLAAPAADDRNNVELIVFQPYAGQTFTVKVGPRTIAAKANLSSGTNNQDFGLWVYNAH